MEKDIFITHYLKNWHVTVGLVIVAGSPLFGKTCLTRERKIKLNLFLEKSKKGKCIYLAHKCHFNFSPTILM